MQVLGSRRHGGYGSCVAVWTVRVSCAFMELEVLPVL
jgi:hypothetical protein